MKNQETTVLNVNPVTRKSAQGRHKQVFNLIDYKTGEITPTVGMGKNKEFGVPTEYSFKLTSSLTKLVTGLDKLIDNPFKDLEPASIIEDYGLSQEWLKPLETIVKQSQIKLQTKSEITDNVAYDFYNDTVTSTMFSSNWKNQLGKEKNYLESFKIILYDGPNRFSDETPRGRLAIQLIKNHPRIAKSNLEKNTAVHDWFISEENEAQMEKQKKRDIIEDALFNWGLIKRNSTPFIAYQLASLLTNHDGNPLVKGKMRDSTVKERISDYINESTTYQIENIEKFDKFYKMLETKEGRERFFIMYVIGQAINVNVITVRDGFYIWNNKVGQPVHKHNTYDALVSNIQREYSNYDPKDDSVTNWYKDLYEELSTKGVWVE